MEIDVFPSGSGGEVIMEPSATMEYLITEGHETSMLDYMERKQKSLREPSARTGEG
jgi:hypothetical protein